MKKTLAVCISILFVMALFVATNAVAGDAEYKGGKKCKACHIKQYKAWAKTTMATSFENLKKGVKVEEKKSLGL